MLILMIVGFYFMIIKPQKKRQAEALAIVESVAPGMDVMTTAGIYGTVTSVDDDVITLSVAPGVEIRYAKAAVAKIKHDELEVDAMDHDQVEPLADDAADSDDGTAAGGATETTASTVGRGADGTGTAVPARSSDRS
jgi:preprotein translocase subunit YajC